MVKGTLVISLLTDGHRMKPQHINATREDLAGNQGLGRYVFITGSDERANLISQSFSQVTVKYHPRQHNLYIGTLEAEQGKIDVAAISSGMGGPSMDIILNELIFLGVTRILRVGTAGSLQPQRIHCGDVVIVSAAVRDDKASWDYIYPEYPAIASFEYLTAAKRAAKLFDKKINIHTGIVHSKSSLYAREMGYSLLEENNHYMSAMKKAGVVASEMECAQLFTVSSLMSASQTNPILSGAILAIVGDDQPFSSNQRLIQRANEAAIALSLETIRQMTVIDQQ